MTKIASIALALALATTPASASIYTSVGFGFCMPAEGEYSYMKASGVASTLDCSAKCDETNATGQHPTHHYRGFTRVRAGNALNLARDDCICFYDGHKLPTLGLDSNDWTRHEPEGDVSDGVGRVADSDGTAGIHCYEILVEESTEPNHDLSGTDVIWNGYKSGNGRKLLRDPKTIEVKNNPRLWGA